MHVLLHIMIIIGVSGSAPKRLDSLDGYVDQCI